MSSLLVLLIAHFIGDFVFQSNWMALNKSKEWGALTIHVAVYSWTVCVAAWAMYPTRSLFPFAVLTFLSHFATDAVTSRITSRLWFVEGGTFHGTVACVKYNDSKRHWFFVAIGADQLIHALTLAATLQMLK